MLRFLQEQKFERLGGDETVTTDVRVLAATNQDLESLVAQGKFRQDLYYRLGVFAIHLPPLHERGDDLLLLVQHYLRRFNRELGKDVQTVAPAALEVLRQYPWPGNVRELQSALKQALLRATGSVLMPEFLPDSLTKRNGAAAAAAEDILTLGQFIDGRIAAGSEDLYAEALRRLERLLVTKVLQHTGGNQLQAAKVLGITRGSLRNKVRELGITISRTVEDEGAAG
jgi:two-component system nitrogen regulation response regulator GlnG